jgi:hypothetical protein
VLCQNGTARMDPDVQELSCPVCRTPWGSFNWRPLRKPPRVEPPHAHAGTQCSSCGQHPIFGPLFACCTCARLQLCHDCFMNGHHPEHAFVQHRTPTSAAVPAARQLMAVACMALCPASSSAGGQTPPRPQHPQRRCTRAAACKVLTNSTAGALPMSSGTNAMGAPMQVAGHSMRLPPINRSCHRAQQCAHLALDLSTHEVPAAYGQPPEQLMVASDSHRHGHTSMLREEIGRHVPASHPVQTKKPYSQRASTDALQSWLPAHSASAQAVRRRYEQLHKHASRQLRSDRMDHDLLQ